MKKVLFALLLVCAIPVAAAQQTWNFTADPAATGTRLFCGNSGGASGVYNAAPLFDITSGPKTTTLAPGTYRCAVKSYRPAGAVCAPASAVTVDCTAFSNEVVALIPVPPLFPPSNLQFILSLACDDTTHLCTLKLAQLPLQ